MKCNRFTKPKTVELYNFKLYIAQHNKPKTIIRTTEPYFKAFQNRILYITTEKS